MPAIRGFVSGNQHMVGHFNDSDTVLEFVNAKNMQPLAALGTSCPDHFLRTKIRPLVVPFDPAKSDIDAVLAGLPEQVEAYRQDYAAYYERCKLEDSPALRDPNAVVYLVPGVGCPSRKHLISNTGCWKKQNYSACQNPSAFADAAVVFGGVDILVSNAGIASSSPVEETTLAMWNMNMDILSTGYFLVSREAFRLMRVQDMGGSVVFVASKNGLAASPNAAAYCTAKASEIHLARCLALEGAEAGIRVNVVNPDAVLQGSKIWEGDWLEQRAETYGTDKEGLEELYRNRSMLKRSVFPADIAEACYFFVAETSSKSTGNILNVDAGNVQAFTR